MADKDSTKQQGLAWRYPLQRQHEVNNPIIVNEDIDLQRRMFWEAAISTGIVVDFYRCKVDVSDFYQDPHLEYDEPIRVPIIFDDHPKVKILKMYGWFTEDEDHPTMAYLPMYSDWNTKELLDVRENSLMRISYYGQPRQADFRIMDKKMDSLYGVYWVCKLAPEMSNEFTLVNNHGEHFLQKEPEGRPRGSKYVQEHGSDVDNRKYEDDSFVDNYTVLDSNEDYFSKLVSKVNTENNVITNDPKENKDIVVDTKNKDTGSSSGGD